jgi:hypothetical protein
VSQSLRTAGLRAPWQPGQSGNELGAHRGYRRVLASARKASPEAIERAIQCMRDDAAPWPSRLAAIALILERAWGKPKEHLSLDGAAGANIVIVTGVPRNEDTTQPVATGTTFTIEYNAGEEDATCEQPGGSSPP